VVFVSAPIVLYSAWMFSTDPVYKAWGAQNLLSSPHPLHYLAAYGILLALAACAVRDAWRDKGPTWLALAWVAAVPILAYLPISVQRRLVVGVQVPLGLLASSGLVKISKIRLRSSSIGSKLVVCAVLVMLTLTNVMLVAGSCLALRGQPAPMYREMEEVAALDWIGENERIGFDDVILAAYETGNYMPVRTRARSYVGHGSETLRSNEKRALAVQFFAGATGGLWRRDLLSEYGVDWVFWGPVERELGTFDPREAAYLQPVYEASGYTIFKVR